MSSMLLKNIQTIVSGDISRPVIPGDAIWIVDGLIKKLGSLSNMDIEKGDEVIDCGGMTVCPGLIDSHCHVVLGDYAPRQQQIGFMDSEVHGGVTTFISAGEVHLAGRPRIPRGPRPWPSWPPSPSTISVPGGAKVIGGALILEKGLTKEDFREMAREGGAGGGGRSVSAASRTLPMRRPW